MHGQSHASDNNDTISKSSSFSSSQVKLIPITDFFPAVNPAITTPPLPPAANAIAPPRLPVKRVLFSKAVNQNALLAQNTSITRVSPKPQGEKKATETPHILSQECHFWSEAE
jgi:hypothetical protein